MPAILIVALVLICILLVLGIIAFFVKPRTIYSNKDERNPVENMRVYLFMTNPMRKTPTV